MEKWLKVKEPGFEPHWQHLSTQTDFVVGRSCASARAPAVYQLTPIFDLVVENSSGEQLAALVAVLRHGSPDEQRRKVEKISDETFAEAATAVREN